MATISKKFGFIRTTLANWSASLFAGRAGVVTDSTPGPVERWGWYNGSAWKFAATSGASETFSELTLSGLTANNLPRLDANKKTVASAFGDDGTNATCTRPLTVTGGKTTLAPAAAGYASLNIPTRTGAPISPIEGDIQNTGSDIELTGLGWSNVKAPSNTVGVGPHFTLNSIDGQSGWITQLGASNTLDFWNNTASAWMKRIQFSSAGGAGLFGVTAPTTRPTVNAAATDLATCIALTNQLRTHLIACGLVQ